MKTTEQITWRKATEEEIEKGLDSPINKGMFELSRKLVEDNEPIEETLEDKAKRLSLELESVLNEMKK